MTAVGGRSLSGWAEFADQQQADHAAAVWAAEQRAANELLLLGDSLPTPYQTANQPTNEEELSEEEGRAA